MKPYYDDGRGIVIYHGDARELLADRAADVMITDPPYGMAYVSSKTTRRPIAGDKDEALRDEVLALWGDKPAAVFGTWKVPKPKGTKQLIVWFKASVGPGMGDLSMPWGHATEEIYILGHPTPKPVGLMVELIECAPDGYVIDPFMGVGATLLAAKNLGRKVIGIELEEKYCEVAARRLSQEVLAL